MLWFIFASVYMIAELNWKLRVFHLGGFFSQLSSHGKMMYEVSEASGSKFNFEVWWITLSQVAFDTIEW